MPRRSCSQSRGPLVDIELRIELKNSQRNDFLMSPSLFHHLDNLAGAESFRLRGGHAGRVCRGSRIEIETDDDHVAFAAKSVQRGFESHDRLPPAHAIKRNDFDVSSFTVLPKLGTVAMRLDSELDKMLRFQKAAFKREVKRGAARDLRLGLTHIQVGVDVDAPDA